MAGLPSRRFLEVGLGGRRLTWSGSVEGGLGVATIYVVATKFYVVDDASTNRTYEYGSTGTAVENYVVDTGNTAPRGAVSRAAETTVWVVDANKKAYVYNTGGGLLGSWTANATVEGITTNGTDIWIVDGKQDKVLRYTNAAGLLSGSLNAASSFSLNSGNSAPYDLVRDSTSIWVVNDSNTDKVFKYSLIGSFPGSWTIAGAGSSSTGIRLDPTGGGTLWTVDSGTDRVYQFDNARARTSDLQPPPTSFALAAGIANPQGTADPPAGGVTPARALRDDPESRQVRATIRIATGCTAEGHIPVTMLDKRALTGLAADLLGGRTKKPRLASRG